jgi:hypothetical protein
MQKLAVTGAATVGGIALTQWLEKAGYSQTNLMWVWVGCAVFIVAVWLVPYLKGRLSPSTIAISPAELAKTNARRIEIEQHSNGANSPNVTGSGNKFDYK